MVMRSYEVHRFRCQHSSYGPPGGGAGGTVLGLVTRSAAFDVLFAAGECGPRRVFSDMGATGTVSGSATRFAAFGVFLAAGECGPRCVFSDMSDSTKTPAVLQHSQQCGAPHRRSAPWLFWLRRAQLTAVVWIASGVQFTRPPSQQTLIAAGL